MKIHCISFTVLPLAATAFTASPSILKSSSSLAASGQGFGKDQKRPDNPTYSQQESQPLSEVIDSESAMSEFFQTNQQWHPFFSQLADKDADATDFLLNNDETFEFHEESSPWRRQQGVPTEETERQVLSEFLDQMQKSLLDIPVDETTEDDANDLHFVEEGRRILVCSRFHVLAERDESNAIETHDRLFAACWNEIMHLRDVDEIDSGSIILAPGSSLPDLRRFVDMNLQQPLRWLGMHSHFEVATMQRGSPAVRVIYKLSEIPTDVGNGPDTM